MPKILSYGSLNLDYVYRVPHFVAPGETLAPSGRDIHCGGKGLNQSVAAARAGGTVFHAGKVGGDGQALLAMLTQNAIDTQFVTTSDAPTGHAIIQVEPGGQNCILLFGGSNREITQGEIDRAVLHFGPGDWLILQNEISNVEYLIGAAARRGMSIAFNPSPFEAEPFEFPLHLLSLLIFNEIEGATLAGSDDENVILDRLRQRLPNTGLLMTLGRRGCVYDDGTQRLAQPAYPVKAVDTTAAGDTFAGYFIACLSGGMSPARCLALASRAAAIAVSKPGAAPSIPTMQEVLLAHGTV